MPHTMHRKGFSLMEILVVLAISVVLAALVLPAAAKARARGLTTKTEATIAAIELALSLYETDFGDYPLSSGTAGTVVKMLMSKNEDPRWKGPYLRFKEKDFCDRELVDPWNEPYYYQYPQTLHSTTPFILYSGGPDRTETTPDDIGNW
ncbi:MAG: type II secretion system protein GspG [Candidatus Omnitrophota bacterium]